jgi:hypothetical protein
MNGWPSPAKKTATRYNVKLERGPESTIDEGRYILTFLPFMKGSSRFMGGVFTLSSSVWRENVTAASAIRLDKDFPCSRLTLVLSHRWPPVGASGYEMGFRDSEGPFCFVAVSPVQIRSQKSEIRSKSGMPSPLISDF